MEETKKSGFQFVGFQIIKSHIEKNGFDKVGDNLKLGFSPRGEKDESKKEFRLYLGVNISNTEKSFNVSIEAVGFYKFSTEIEGPSLSDYFYVNAPAILFPYIRAYISTLTTLSGFETVTLPTINFTFLGDALKINTKEVQLDLKLE